MLGQSQQNAEETGTQHINLDDLAETTPHRDALHTQHHLIEDISTQQDLTRLHCSSETLQPTLFEEVDPALLPSSDSVLHDVVAVDSTDLWSAVLEVERVLCVTPPTDDGSPNVTHLDVSLAVDNLLKVRTQRTRRKKSDMPVTPPSSIITRSVGLRTTTTTFDHAQ